MEIGGQRDVQATKKYSFWASKMVGKTVTKRMKTHTFYEHGFEFHLRDISTEKEGEIEPSRLETGSQKRGISKKRFSILTKDSYMKTIILVPHGHPL